MRSAAGADALGQLLELGAVVEGEGQHLRPVPAAVGRPVELLQLARPRAAARCSLPLREEALSSVQLGIAGAQPWRETANAPQALA